MWAALTNFTQGTSAHLRQTTEKTAHRRTVKFKIVILILYYDIICLGNMVQFSVPQNKNTQNTTLR